ncbi:hypothetical protein TcasGA2_TC034601 [Tribolium castaneum]|uniref:Uncharacterized protein n=1 Tax=Tribolium castaneum TaxID=7070 RepID=A0A139WLA2_TRICA|nr:hypothetical protein TcasGA2_TC034601 [Tribolium castaneum]
MVSVDGSKKDLGRDLGHHLEALDCDQCNKMEKNHQNVKILRAFFVDEGQKMGNTLAQWGSWRG